MNPATVAVIAAPSPTMSSTTNVPPPSAPPCHSIPVLFTATPLARPLLPAPHTPHPRSASVSCPILPVPLCSPRSLQCLTLSVFHPSAPS
ncbi:hypothetical protein B1218_38275, partial [Pseudomonas ogarae]